VLIGGLVAVLLAAMIVPLSLLVLWLVVIGITGLGVRRFA